MSDHYGNVVTYTLDNDTLLTSLCEFPLSPIEEDKGNFSCKSACFCHGKAANKSKNFLCLQILLNAKSVWQNFIDP